MLEQKDQDGVVVGIDATRNRSGGARAHIRGILSHFDEHLGIKAVHLWAYRALLDEIPDRSWLVKHHHPHFERSLAHQLLWQAFILAKSAKSIGCDVVFATDASTLSHFQPLVVLSQDLLSYEPGVMQSFPWGRDRLRLELIKIIQNRAFKRSAGVLFLTKYAAHLVQTSCGPLSRIALAPHGIDDMFRSVASSKPHSSVDHVPPRVRCLYVSNTDLYKHQWHVVEAIRQLRDRGLDVELTLVGGGSGPAQLKLLDAMARCDPQARFVTQMSFVKHSDLPKILSQADIYVFASSCENLPVTLLEGMAAGLPIACSNRGPMPEVLQDAGVYFDPENSTSIADAVQGLIDSNELRLKFSHDAHRLASNFSWERCARDTFGFIHETCLQVRNST